VATIEVSDAAVLGARSNLVHRADGSINADACRAAARSSPVYLPFTSRPLLPIPLLPMPLLPIPLLVPIAAAVPMAMGGTRTREHRGLWHRRGADANAADATAFEERLSAAEGIAVVAAVAAVVAAAVAVAAAVVAVAEGTSASEVQHASTDTGAKRHTGTALLLRMEARERSPESPAAEPTLLQ
jgi:hypothetical protein